MGGVWVGAYTLTGSEMNSAKGQWPGNRSFSLRMSECQTHVPVASFQVEFGVAGWVGSGVCPPLRSQPETMREGYAPGPGQ